jgi:NADH-quinone oxidoreductase subunit G
VFAPGDARDDWTIFRALSAKLGHTLPFDRFDQLRAAMFAEVPALGQEGLADYGWSMPSLSGPAPSGPIGYPIQDFYLTNPIARASETMQRCSAELLHGADFAEAAE